MEVLEAIRQRRAVRDYKPVEVSQPILRKLIEAANWAPSAMNGQPWRFTVITDKPTLEKIASQAKDWLLANETGVNSQMHSLLADPHYDVLHHAPALIVITAPAALRWSVEACAISAENIMLAAMAMGLGSCWIGLIEGWLNTQQGHALLDLAPNDRVLASLVIGYPKGATPAPSRKQPEITWISAKQDQFTEDMESWPVSSGLYGSLILP